MREGEDSLAIVSVCCIYQAPLFKARLVCGSISHYRSLLAFADAKHTLSPIYMTPAFRRWVALSIPLAGSLLWNIPLIVFTHSLRLLWLVVHLHGPGRAAVGIAFRRFATTLLPLYKPLRTPYATLIYQERFRFLSQAILVGIQ